MLLFNFMWFIAIKSLDTPAHKHNHEPISRLGHVICAKNHLVKKKIKTFHSIVVIEWVCKISLLNFEIKSNSRFIWFAFEYLFVIRIFGCSASVFMHMCAFQWNYFGIWLCLYKSTHSMYLILIENLRRKMVALVR